MLSPPALPCDMLHSVGMATSRCSPSGYLFTSSAIACLSTPRHHPFAELLCHHLLHDARCKIELYCSVGCIVTEQADRIHRHWLEVRSWVRKCGSFARSEELILNKHVSKPHDLWTANMFTSIVVCMRYNSITWALC